MSRISTLFITILLVFSLSAISSKKILATQTFKYKVSQSLADCWQPSLSQGRIARGETDVSKTPIILTFACRTDQSKLKLTNYNFTINPCIYDNLSVLNMNGKRYKQCGTISYNANNFDYVIKLTCKNINDTYSEVPVDLKKFISVKNGVPSCAKK